MGPFVSHSILLAQIAAGPDPVSARVHFGDPTELWPGPVPTEARVRAETWAAALGGRLLELDASDEADGFLETLAIVERPEPLAWPTPDPLETTVTDLLGPGIASPSSAGDEDDSGPPPIVRGRVQHEGVAYHLAIASSGPTHAVVIFAVKPEEESLYSARIERKLSNLRGTSPPLWPFRPWRWRGTGLFLLGGLAGALWLTLSSRRSFPPERIPLFVAVVVACSSAVLALAGGLALRSRAAQLALVGATSWGAALELFGLGLAIGATAWITGLVQDRRHRRIRSAPREGAFSERNTGPRPAVAARPPTVERSHPDGRSRLEDPGVGANAMPPERRG